MHNTFNVILWTSADICVVVYDDLGWKNQTTRYNCRFSAMSLALRVILVRRYMRHAWRSQTAIDYSAQNLVIWWNTSFWQHFISTNNSKLECRWSITDNYSKDSEWSNLCSAVPEHAATCHNRTMTANQKRKTMINRASVKVVMTGTQPIDQSKHSQHGFSNSHALSA